MSISLSHDAVSYSYLQMTVDYEKEKRQDEKLKTKQELVAACHERVFYIGMNIDVFQSSYRTTRNSAASALREHTDKTYGRKPTREEYIELYNADENRMIEEFQKYVQKHELEADIARQLAHSNELEKAQRNFVSSAQLIECRELPSPERDDAPFKIFYMKKLYTINGKKYIADETCEVGMYPHSYDAVMGDIDREPNRYGDRDFPRYENLKHAKCYFLRNTKHFDDRLEAAPLTESELGMDCFDLEVCFPRHCKSTFLRFQKNCYFNVPNVARLYKLVEINNISYIVDREYSAEDVSTLSDSLLIADFMQTPINVSAKHEMMKTNYNKFDLIHTMVTKEFEKQELADTLDSSDMHTQRLEAFLKDVMDEDNADNK